MKYSLQILIMIITMFLFNSKRFRRANKHETAFKCLCLTEQFEDSVSWLLLDKPSELGNGNAVAVNNANYPDIPTTASEIANHVQVTRRPSSRH